MSQCLTEHLIKRTRKTHTCDSCGKKIDVGQNAIKYVGVDYGDFFHAHFHPECRVAEIALNRKHETYWDEWYRLGDADREDYPWLKREHPVAYLRLVTPVKRDVAE